MCRQKSNNSTSLAESSAMSAIQLKSVTLFNTSSLPLDSNERAIIMQIALLQPNLKELQLKISNFIGPEKIFDSQKSCQKFGLIVWFHCNNDKVHQKLASTKQMWQWKTFKN